MSTLITPRTLSGFRDYLPNVMLAREQVLQIARDVYRGYGFTPIDTPACEALDVLLGKGGDESDKLVYRVQSARGDKIETMGLRFDLTVPFARFSAQYINELGTPFKRYAMGPVWRGERPGQGRYREFWQCDFDTIGTTSNAADIETVLVINDLFEKIGFERFEIRVNNRKLLNGVLNDFGLSVDNTAILRVIDKLPKNGRDLVKQELIGAPFGDAVKIVSELQSNVNEALWPNNGAELRQLHLSLVAKAREELTSIRASYVFPELPSILLELVLSSLKNRIKQDKTDPTINSIREKILKEKGLADLAMLDELVGIAKRKAYQHIDDTVAQELVRRITGIGLSPVEANLVLAFVSLSGTPKEIRETIADKYARNDLVRNGLDELEELIDVAKTSGVPDDRIKIDLSICRGLDYYTGMIYETFLTDLPEIGSVCSGGRYDNLASLYTKQVLPGVGASLGLDRLISAMEELKHPLLTSQTTPAEVLIVQFDASRLGDYQRIARALRAVGVCVEVYPDTKRVGQQLAYAERRGFKLAVIAGAAEFEQGIWKVKNLAKREEISVPEAELVKRVREMVESSMTRSGANA